MSRIAEHYYGDRPYPHSAGFKERTTSHTAARAIAHKLPTLRDRVLQAIEASGSKGLTPDETAAVLGETVLAVRPRLSELSKLGKIVRNGQKRANESGLMAAVWVAA